MPAPSATVSGCSARSSGQRAAVGATTEPDDAARLDRATLEQERRFGGPGGPVGERGGSRELARAVQHEAERAVGVVGEHVDDRPAEVRVLEHRGGDEQPSGGGR